MTDHTNPHEDVPARHDRLAAQQDRPDVAALQRAHQAGGVQVYISGGTGHIKFTHDAFRAWYLAERAAIERQVRADERARVAAEIEETVPRGRRPRADRTRYVSDVEWAVRVARGEA